MMPARWETFSALSLPPSIIEEDLDGDPSSQHLWDGECADVLHRCSSITSSDCDSLPSLDCESLPNSDSESLTGSNSFLECDFNDLDNISIPDSDLLTDPEGEQLCPSLLKLIKRCLTKARITSLKCSRLLPPDDLLQHMGQELLHLAFSEPCGLRGALIDLCVEHGKVCHSVAQVSADKTVVPTFQLTVLLRLDSRLWPRIQGLFSTKPVPGSGQSLKLSSGFKILKKKLYSSEEYIVEEC
ncbi:DNA damage-inducible transcript 4 protein [Bombina bombina]|uniref:DNA damage-inducible transcript 4 protein n=1 Tax=Bombina bombina TaxID=8345 RepID=UPI00235AAD3F|nr:DNA damage-inducible transcript 4 protein [Bombina bombina]